MPSFISLTNHNELYCYSKGPVTPMYYVLVFIDVLRELVNVVVQSTWSLFEYDEVIKP